MHVCKYLNQRVRRIGKQNEKSFKGVSKTKKKKKHMLPVVETCLEKYMDVTR